jgi:hypothetical protein
MHIHTYKTMKLPIMVSLITMDTAIEFPLKNASRMYKTTKLPNMVSLIIKWTLPLNSHQKMGPGHIYMYKTMKLPNMVSLITKRTPQILGLDAS